MKLAILGWGGVPDSRKAALASWLVNDPKPHLSTSERAILLLQCQSTTLQPHLGVPIAEICRQWNISRNVPYTCKGILLQRESLKRREGSGQSHQKISLKPSKVKRLALMLQDRKGKINYRYNVRRTLNTKPCQMS